MISLVDPDLIDVIYNFKDPWRKVRMEPRYPHETCVCEVLSEQDVELVLLSRQFPIAYVILWKDDPLEWLLHTIRKRTQLKCRSDQQVL